MGSNARRRAEKKQRRAHDGNPLSIPELLLAAASAFLVADLAGGARFVAVLGEAPPRAVGDALSRMLGESIVGAWRRGWQPADVARLVERKVGARHARFLVDVIALDARRYAGEAVDDRWADQLSGLGAEVWWREGEPHLDQWGVREGVDRADALTCAVEVLTVLLHLAPLPRL